MDNSKIKAIKEWPMPKTVRGVWSFLGLANFYCRFIEGYAQVVQPLNDLTKKDTPFAWKEAQQMAFDTLKLCFTTAPIFAYPDNDRVFCLETDASNFATGAALSIEQNGKWHPVAFSSHSMTPEECTVTTQLQTKKCLVSSDHWNNGDTIWKAHTTSLRSGMTMQTYNNL